MCLQDDFTVFRIESRGCCWQKVLIIQKYSLLFISLLKHSKCVTILALKQTVKRLNV